MNVEDLEVFLAIARLGSVNAAATELSVPRSRLRRSMARLEKHLGTALTLPDSSGVRMTQAGQELLGGAARLVGRRGLPRRAHPVGGRPAHGLPEGLRAGGLSGG